MVMCAKQILNNGHVRNANPRNGDVQGQKAELQQMYQEWPFFQSTIDLIEMILSKCDMRIAAMYDAVLAETEEEKALGVVLRGKFENTVTAVLEVLLCSWRSQWSFADACAHVMPVHM